VRRSRPTLLCLHRYSATDSASLSMERRCVGRVETLAGVRSVGVRVEVGAGLYF
jgi:hypothetical protein